MFEVQKYIYNIPLKKTFTLIKGCLQYIFSFIGKVWEPIRRVCVCLKFSNSFWGEPLCYSVISAKNYVIFPMRKFNIVGYWDLWMIKKKKKKLKTAAECAFILELFCLSCHSADLFLWLFYELLTIIFALMLYTPIAEGWSIDLCYFFYFFYRITGAFFFYTSFTDACGMSRGCGQVRSLRASEKKKKVEMKWSEYF